MKFQITTRRGFTMVEIMIVVAIIGLLAVIAVPNYVRSRAASQKTACINNLRLIDSAVNQYAMEFKKPGTTPVSETEVTPYLKQGSGTSCPAGGKVFADSYQVTDCQTLPQCLKLSAEHNLQ